MVEPDRYQPLPSLLELPGHFLRKLTRRGRRTAVVLGVLLVAALGAGVAIGIPKIADSKREHAAADARAAARAHAARVAQLRAELRLVHGRGTPARGLA